MTPQQENAFNTTQIQHDTVRSNLMTALLQNSLSNQALITVRRDLTAALLQISLSNQALIAAIQAYDMACQAADETQEQIS